MYESVISGDIDLLDDLMDEPAADINMIWVSQELVDGCYTTMICIVMTLSCL